MTITSKKLAAALDLCDIRIRRAFRDFEPEQRQQAETAFRRHMVACGRSQMAVDPSFVRELVHDIKHGFFESEEPLAMVAASVM